MENYLFISSCHLIKDVVFKPRDVFENISKGRLAKETLIVFCLGALLPFFKSFNFKSQHINFYASPWKNHLFSILSIPQVTWLVSYAAYFSFLLIVFCVCKVFSRDANFITLMVSFMAISSIGIAGQVFFYILKFILAKDFLLFGFYVLFLWAILLFLRAIKSTQKISTLKSLISILFPAIVIIGIMGLTGITPYLAWLTT